VLRNAAERDDPLAHPFEGMLRALASTSLAQGARVALDGHGGDHLFVHSGYALAAQHLFDLRWGTLLKMWRGSGMPVAEYLKRCLRPNLASPTLEWIGQVGGRRPPGAWDARIPDWISSPSGPIVTPPERLPDEGPVPFEARWLMTAPMFGRVNAGNHAFGLAEGIALRSPFLDRRLIAFVASRPMSDRGAGPGAKRILRRAMQGLIPDSVLEPRFRKTGVVLGYVRRQLTGALQSAGVGTIGPRGNLVRMGLVDAEKFDKALARYARTRDHELGAALLHTIAVEGWIAVRQGER
jgi:asparagine synthase (glutamine-hydrolysing)